MNWTFTIIKFFFWLLVRPFVCFNIYMIWYWCIYTDFHLSILVFQMRLLKQHLKDWCVNLCILNGIKQFTFNIITYIFVLKSTILLSTFYLHYVFYILLSFFSPCLFSWFSITSLNFLLFLESCTFLYYLFIILENRTCYFDLSKANINSNFTFSRQYKYLWTL